MYTIPVPCGTGLYPLHDFVKADTIARLDEQMNMCRHYTKVGKAEAVFFFRILQGYKHNFTPQFVFKNPNFVIGP